MFNEDMKITMLFILLFLFGGCGGSKSEGHATDETNGSKPDPAPLDDDGFGVGKK